MWLPLKCILNYYLFNPTHKNTHTLNYLNTLAHSLKKKWKYNLYFELVAAATCKLIPVSRLQSWTTTNFPNSLGYFRKKRNKVKLLQPPNRISKKANEESSAGRNRHRLTTKHEKTTNRERNNQEYRLFVS